jgi:hypothetical protein
MFNVRWDQIKQWALALLGGAVLVVGLHAMLNTHYTRITCVRAGYPSYDWSPVFGGVCSRLENGTTIVVSVDSLK